MRVIKYGLPLVLVGMGSFWFCLAVVASSPGIAVCSMAFIGLAGMMLVFESPKPKIFNRYAIYRKVFPGTEEGTGLIASYRGLRGTIEINCRRSLSNRYSNSAHIFLDKEEAKNLRDMLNEFLELG